jgi:NAD(P)-dependent dehydrogenase (short-subunit alcohol dehydrogenase family)
MSSKKVWFITGASRGMGVDFAKAALTAGHAVVASGRDSDRVSKALGPIFHCRRRPNRIFCTGCWAAKSSGARHGWRSSDVTVKWSIADCKTDRPRRPTDSMAQL